MKQILKSLQNSPVVEKILIEDFRYGKTFQFIKIKAILKDSSILYIREYQSLNDVQYSYHWQTRDGKLLSRWDNSPFHPEISTHPHHRHTREGKIVEFYHTNLDDILNFIQENMGKNK